MKKTLLAALLAALMLVCTGCASFLERDYSVVQPHSSTYYESEDRSVLRAESYQDLVNDLMLLLTGGAREGTIWLYAGTEPLDASAAAAVRATTEYLFRTVGVRRIQCFVLPINYRAVLVLERCGFVKEGTIREGFYWPDKGIVDLTVYSLLPTDKKPKSTGPAYYL